MSAAEEIAKAKAKIAKLLNMTVANGCSEDEQETAMSMAASLAARLGIDMEAARAKEPDAVKRKAVRKSFTQEFKIHQTLAMQAAAELYGCKVYAYDGGKGGCFFVGREENVDLAESTAFWLMRQVELLYKQHLPKGLSQTVRAQYRKTFKAACAHRVYQRAIELMRDMRMNERAAQAATGQNALVVQDYFKTLAQENEDFFKPSAEVQARLDANAAEHKRREEARRAALSPAERNAEDRERDRYMKKLMSRKGPRARTLPTGVGTSAGMAAGDRVQLRKEIS